MKKLEKRLDKSFLAIARDFVTNGGSRTTALLRMSSSAGTLEDIFFVGC